MGYEIRETDNKEWPFEIVYVDGGGDVERVMGCKTSEIAQKEIASLGQETNWAVIHIYGGCVQDVATFESHQTAQAYANEIRGAYPPRPDEDDILIMAADHTKET